MPPLRSRARSLAPLAALALVLALVTPLPSGAQRGRITSPREQFGRNLGDDYWLANYTQIVDYWQKLARQSNRMKLVRFGTTGEGRPMYMAIISSPENLRSLDRYRDISARLARAEGLTDAEARKLARDGKSIVWIDGGLHSTETLGATQLAQTVYELVSLNDAETQRFLRDDIILAVVANPDGVELVANWYMRQSDTLKRSTSGLPRLYNRYVGHDNNRDSYMASQPETQAMDSLLFRAWYPQIMYNHHQAGPAGTVMAAPPYRDPFNYNFDALVPEELNMVGAAMNTRFVREGKAGVTQGAGSEFSTWWNGGLRTTVYFHNMIGLLTETIGNPTPMTIPVVPERLLPSGSLPLPILPGTWRFAQSVAYSVTANRAVLDVASRQRENLLYNIYQMGRNSIERGSRDNWTLTPSRVDVVAAAVDSARRRDTTLSPARALALLQDPATRDPRGYIIRSDQPDFLTAVKFANALVKNGVAIMRATAPFTVGGTRYPAGSIVVKTAQAFRPHVRDMFEPQNHPNDIPYPGGPPTPPYDNAGWTLAFQMGVSFDRVLDGFEGPFEVVQGYAAPIAPPQVPAPRTGAEYDWSGAQNDAFVAANRLVAAGEPVWRSSDGQFHVQATPAAAAIASAVAGQKGVAFTQDVPAAAVAATRVPVLRKPRIALWDAYGGSMTSGWTRFILDQFEFPYEVVYAPQLDAGNLRARYDVLVLPDGARIGGGREESHDRPVLPADIPAEYRSRMGRMSVEKTLPAIREFLRAGGTVLASGSATGLAYQLGLPVANPLADSAGKPFPSAKYYVPGSVLSARIDTSASLTAGMPGERVDVMFDNSPVFRLLPGARAAGVRRVAWFDSPTPLRSGWAWGQRYLEGTDAVVEAKVGEGRLVLYGPEMNFRSQSHGTFKLLFNAIYPAPDR